MKHKSVSSHCSSETTMDKCMLVQETLLSLHSPVFFFSLNSFASLPHDLFVPQIWHIKDQKDDPTASFDLLQAELPEGASLLDVYSLASHRLKWDISAIVRNHGMLT